MDFTATYQAEISGYRNLTCLNYQQAVCLNSTNTSELYLCSTVPDDFCVADVIYSDHFNRAQSSFSGMLGLGASSPIWSIMNATTSNTSLPNQFQIQMSNITDWTFADATYRPSVVDSTLVLGNMDTSVYNPQAFAKIQDTTLDGIKLENLEFGRYYSSNQSYSAQSIFAKNSDDRTMNSALLSPDLRGLGLPVDSYLKVANYLSTITMGGAQCFIQGCVMTAPCSYYNIWDDYFFFVRFATQQPNQYIRIPLSTFAQSDEKNGVCFIHIQEVYEEEATVFGAMFFQSFFLQGYLEINDFVATPTYKLYRNQNALPNVYLGNQQMTQLNFDVFVVQPQTISGVYTQS